MAEELLNDPMKRRREIPRRLVYLELLDSMFDWDGGSSRAAGRIARDFPWTIDQEWEMERWGLRYPFRGTPPGGESVPLRGLALPFRVFPRVLLPMLVWMIQFVLALRRPRAGIMLAYSPLMAAGVAAARFFRPSSVLVVRVIESVSSRARHLYRRPVEARVLRAIERFGLRRADLVIPVGPFTHEIATAAGVREGKILELPNPVSFRVAQLASTAAPGGPIRLVSAGRLVPEKGIDVLILAFAEVFDEIPDVVLEVAGDGPQRPALEKLVERLGIEARVKFAGYLPPDSMPSFLAGASLAVLPSRVEEGLPRVLVEAGLAGCALVGTDLGGIKDIVEPDRTGVLVPPNNPGALAEALLRLLRDPGQLRRLGREAQGRSRKYLHGRESALRAIRERMEVLRCGSTGSHGGPND